MKVLIASALAVSLAVPAWAQTSCWPREQVVTNLKEKLGQVPAARAIDAAGRMLEILVNDDNGKWSAFVTDPGGLTCIVSGGTNFETIDPTAPGDLN